LFSALGQDIGVILLVDLEVAIDGRPRGNGSALWLPGIETIAEFLRVGCRFRLVYFASRGGAEVISEREIRVVIFRGQS
jgi:hypothetical protein